MRTSKQLFLFMLMVGSLNATDPRTLTIDVNGQLSLNFAQAFEGQFSNSPSTLRYIPKLRADYQMNDHTRLGMDVSLDLYHFALGDSSVSSGNDFYRLTFRFDSPKTQLRIGLQKINFGPARMLRVLQWFDQVDLRDPLALSPGVWASMVRHYFDNGMNLRFWAIRNASDAQRINFNNVDQKPMDYGGRLEYPIQAGTLGLTCHTVAPFNEDFLTENRAAFDIRLDAEVGLWSEVMISHTAGLTMSDQVTAMLGVDYTFGFGNGLYVALESLNRHSGIIQEEMSEMATSYALTANYSIGLSDGLNAYLYALDLPQTPTQYMPMLGWQHTIGNWLFYLAIYDMPELVPGGTLGLPGDTGLQFNIAFNH